MPGCPTLQDVLDRIDGCEINLTIMINATYGQIMTKLADIEVIVNEINSKLEGVLVTESRHAQKG